MLYVLVNLWAKSYRTTSDQTVVQFRAIKLCFLKRTKLIPPPHPLFNFLLIYETTLGDKARAKNGHCFDDGLYVRIQLE